MERSVIQLAKFLLTVSKALSTKKFEEKKQINKRSLIWSLHYTIVWVMILKLKKKSKLYTWYGGIKSERNIKWKVFVETTNSNMCFGLTFVIQLSENNFFTKHIYIIVIIIYLKVLWSWWLLYWQFIQKFIVLEIIDNALFLIISVNGFSL